MLETARRRKLNELTTRKQRIGAGRGSLHRMVRCRLRNTNSDAPVAFHPNAYSHAFESAAHHRNAANL
jgi:hypothetical protein